LRSEDAALVERWIDQDITVEYWPRERVEEAWVRDSGADPHAANRDELQFRGYSFATKERGNVAVLFVDDIETYDSATFVLLHELVHLHLPSWSPPTQKTLAQVEEEEDRADAVAGALMEELLGYEFGIREVKRLPFGLGTRIVLMDEPDNVRVANPQLPVCRCCPMRMG
jgi:hypothetical protein